MDLADRALPLRRSLRRSEVGGRVLRVKADGKTAANQRVLLLDEELVAAPQ